MAMVARTPMNQNCTPRASMAPGMWTGRGSARGGGDGGGLGGADREGEDELVPGEGEEDEAGGGDRGGGEGKCDAPEGDPVAGSLGGGGAPQRRGGGAGGGVG